jgi:hypothetical protein
MPTGQPQRDGTLPEREEMERHRGSGLDEEGTVELTTGQQPEIECLLLREIRIKSGTGRLALSRLTRARALCIMVCGLRATRPRSDISSYSSVRFVDDSCGTRKVGVHWASLSASATLHQLTPRTWGPVTAFPLRIPCCFRLVTAEQHEG